MILVAIFVLPLFSSEASVRRRGFLFVVLGSMMKEKGEKERMGNITPGFVLNYIIIPMVVGWGLWSGRRLKNHHRLAVASGFKGIFYWYCAAANFLNYINGSWAISGVAGFTVALAIIEGCNGWIDLLEESRKAYEK